MAWALHSLCRPSAKSALTHHLPRSAVVLPDGSRPPGAVPAGRPFPCPVWDRPADANGGLCIGRSFADALGACGSSATNKLCRVYTGALLATTIISVQKQGLNIAYICAILCSYQSDKLEFSSLLIADNSVHKAPFY